MRAAPPLKFYGIDKDSHSTWLSSSVPETLNGAALHMLKHCSPGSLLRATFSYVYVTNHLIS